MRTHPPASQRVGVLLLALFLAIPVMPNVATHGATSAQGGTHWARGLLSGVGMSGFSKYPTGQSLELTLALQPNDATGLGRWDRAVADPGSPQFGRFLSENQFEQRFAPRADNLSQLEQYFGGFGALGFRATPDRLGLSFSLNAGGAQRAFSSELFQGSSPVGVPFRALTTAPSLPEAVSRMIAGVGGLTGVIDGVPPTGRLTGALTHPGPVGAHADFLNGSGGVSGTQWFVGSDYVRLYNETPLLPGGPQSLPNASYATNEAVATLLMSGYNGSTGRNLPPWDPRQIDQYFADSFPPAWTRPTVLGVPISISGILPPSPGPSGNLTDDTNDQIENSLDLEMAGSMAPGSEVVNFYFPASLQYATPSATTDRQIADDFSTALSNALSFNYSGRHLASVSASFGITDLNDTLWNTELEHAAATGVTVIASSGDSGNAPAADTQEYLGAEPGWPASAGFDSTGTVSVGGASLLSGGSATGTFDGTHAPTVAYDGATGTITGQSVWYNLLGGPGNATGSEGGGATRYPEPSWQFHSAAQPSLAEAEGSQAIANLSRGEPDVALSANDTIVYSSTGANGTVYFTVLQGTSVSAPLFAGMVAEWAAVAGHGFGFIDPALYRIASYFSAHPGPGDPFLDVTSGSNYLFHAGPGWDAATGWGGIDASRFLSAYRTAPIVGYQYTGPTPGLPKGPTGVSTLGLLLIASLGALLLGVVVLAVAVSRRPGSTRVQFAPSGYPPIAGGPPPVGGAPTFVCPYCGYLRPAEPVRCPTCGRL
ncbi:MAG: hypothetical protein L3J95_02880 [Thermoplasmata archaeon]|nr:hypothetical protein [Thermoplasmata archaeon]MCI4359351.1 hypothetical protein [Thermoplasmata archaeon]